MKQQNVLWIGRVWPEPSSSAAGSRTLQLIRLFMNQDWSVVFASAAGPSEHAFDLEAIGVACHTIQLNDSSFDDFIKLQQPDIVIFDRFMTEEQFGWRVAEHCSGAMRVLDTIDLHALRLARHAALKSGRALQAQDLHSNTACREVAAIYRSDLSLMISTVEIELLENQLHVPETLLHYTPFLPDPLDTTAKSKWLGFEQRQHFMTIGNFLHEPNWDAVQYLKREVWPLIRKRLPGAELHIYGSYASQKVLELHSPREGLLIKGRAERVDEVMGEARVCLAPLRFGAGMKGKLLDAMLYGTPSVTTPVGAESMHGSLPWNGAIAENANAIADAAVQLYTDKLGWEQAQKNGIQLLELCFAAEEHGSALINKFVQIQNQLNDHRLNNFTGTMLAQQQHAATKYMALWIETKNKAS